MGQALILVNDAKDCHSCEFCMYTDGHYRCTRTKYPYKAVSDCEKRADWCPIIPIPMPISPLEQERHKRTYSQGYCDGWNDCIERIEGKNI